MQCWPRDRSIDNSQHVNQRGHDLLLTHLGLVVSFADDGYFQSLGLPDASRYSLRFSMPSPLVLDTRNTSLKPGQPTTPGKRSIDSLVQLTPEHPSWFVNFVDALVQEVDAVNYLPIAD